MADKGPFLTSCIIFYLSIGAAIFQILEEPNWESATENYKVEKERILKDYPCLGNEGLERILQVRSHLRTLIQRARLNFAEQNVSSRNLAEIVHLTAESSHQLS